MRIDLVDPQHPRVHMFLGSLFVIPPLTAPAAILFGGHRMDVVDIVALLTVNGADAGIATLSEQGETRNGEPAIVGLWIDPELKSHPHYLAWGCALFCRLVDEAHTRCARRPTFYPVTRTEMAIAEEAKRQGASFELVEVIGRDMLMDW